MQLLDEEIQKARQTLEDLKIKIELLRFTERNLEDYLNELCDRIRENEQVL